MIETTNVLILLTDVYIFCHFYIILHVYYLCILSDQETDIYLQKKKGIL